ncbi:hypothetical protein [Mycolicibacterium sp. S3B2]|uniref:hypothetical protein n=1 Tax=Mycolicibacterium sp. S3B2 TaxID=3415120 RepID=UPI003C7D0802
MCVTYDTRDQQVCGVLNRPSASIEPAEQRGDKPLTEAVTQAGITLVKIVERDDPVRWGISGLANNLVNIDALLTVAALLLYPRDEHGNSWDELDRALDRARTNAAQDFQVLRCRYESPLELVLIGGAITSSISGSAWLIANRALAIYNKYLDVKKKRSDVNLAVALNNEVMEHLNLDLATVPENETVARMLTYVSRAAHALEAIETMQVEGDTAPDRTGSNQ